MSPLLLECTPVQKKKNKTKRQPNKDNSTQTQTRSQAGSIIQNIETNKKCNTDFLHRPPYDWSEKNVMQYFESCPGTSQLPTLHEVEELLLRKIGQPKYLCVFSNNKNEKCRVWLPATIMRLYYFDQIHNIVDEFRSVLN